MKTYGYDYAYALTQDKVNDIMQQNLAAVDMPLSYSGQDPVTGASITLDTTLDPWSLAGGGQNSLVKLSVPIKEGYLSVEGLPGVDGSWDMTNVVLLIEVNLGWLGAGDIQELAGEGTRTQLVFSPSADNDKDKAGYVAIIEIKDPSGRLTTVAKGLLTQFAHDAFYANRDNLKYIFAGVAPTPTGVATWLRPVKWQYYISSGAIEALCFLCLLTDTTFPAVPAFDSTALIANCNASVLIAQESFFQNVLLPAIQSAFPTGSFSVSEADESAVITNNGAFTVVVKNKQVATTSFKLSPQNAGNGLQTAAAGGGPLKFFFNAAKLPGASYSWSVGTVNPLVLDLQAGTLTFAADPAPTTTHDQTIKWYDWVLLVAFGITNIAGLVSLIVEIVDGFSDQVNDAGMTNINDKIQSSFGASVVNIANLLDWHVDGETFIGTAGGMNGPLYLQGNLSK